MRNFKLSEIQATAILEMQLRRLAALERKKIEDEYKEVIKLIAELEDILANPRRVLHMINEDLQVPAAINTATSGARGSSPTPMARSATKT